MLITRGSSSFLHDHCTQQGVLKQRSHQLGQLNESEVIRLARLLHSGGRFDVGVDHADSSVVDENVNVELLRLDGFHALCYRRRVLHIDEEVLVPDRKRTSKQTHTNSPIPFSVSRTRPSLFVHFCNLCVRVKTTPQPMITVPPASNRVLATK